LSTKEILETLAECRELLYSATGSALLAGEKTPERDKANIRTDLIKVNNYLFWIADEIVRAGVRPKMRMINGHPNGDPMNDPPSLR
jgi:hypothetical protein